MFGGVLNLLGWAGFGLGLLAGLLMIPLGLGGTFVILGVGVIAGFATDFTRVGVVTLIILAVLAVAGELIESLLGVFTVRRFGASKWAMLGTFFGGIAGGIAGSGVAPVAGSLVGAFAGAFLGAFVGELLHRRRVAESLRAGWGAFLGRLLAVAIKFEIGVVMAIILIWRVVRRE
jgi:uncharacterized protein YqgC (DUF456 family)